MTCFTAAQAALLAGPATRRSGTGAVAVAPRAPRQELCRRRLTRIAAKGNQAQRDDFSARRQQPFKTSRDVRARAFTGDFGDVDPIQGVTIEDAEMLDSILSAGTFDDVRERVRTLAMEGSLTDGVLVAAQKVLERSLVNAGRDTENVVVRSVGAVVELLSETLAVLQSVGAKSALADMLLSLDTAQPAEAQRAVELMRAAFAQGVDRASFVEDLAYFVKEQDAQDAELLKGVAEGTVDLGEYKLEEVLAARREGVVRMKRIIELAEGGLAEGGAKPQQQQPQPQQQAPQPPQPPQA